MANEKSALPSWKDVKTILLTFDRKLLDMSADIRAFIAANESQLKTKD